MNRTRDFSDKKSVTLHRTIRDERRQSQILAPLCMSEHREKVHISTRGRPEMPTLAGPAIPPGIPRYALPLVRQEPPTLTISQTKLISEL